MDLDHLVTPYRENGRTIGGQIKWMLEKGIPQNCIDHAMAQVYKELDIGKTFDSGDQLDHELLRVAQEHHASELHEQLIVRIRDMEKALDMEWNKLTKFQKVMEVLAGRA